MNKIIGGLLVLSLLSGSSTIDLDAAAYDVFRTKHQIVYLVKKEKGQQIESKNIQEMMDSVENDTRSLNNLLKEKNNVIEKIKAIMDLKVYAKAKLTKEQIEEFNRFNKLCMENNRDMQALFKAMDPSEELVLVQNEILHNETDMSFVYNKLNKIKDVQASAIECLKDFNAVGMRTIEAL